MVCACPEELHVLRVTALVGGDDCVREAHRESVRVALEQLEHYTMARIGGNYPPESTAKFIAAKLSTIPLDLSTVMLRRSSIRTL